MSLGRTSSRSLRQLSTAAWITAIVALTVGSVIVWFGFASLLDARARVFETVGPARISVQQLRASVLDQETGIRGYVITRDDRLLQPYTAGRASQKKIDREIRRVIDGDPSEATVVAALDQVQQAMDDWRDSVADPLLDSADQPDLDGTLIRSTAVFDDVRAELDDLEAILQRERVVARTNLEDTTSRLVVSVGATIALFGALASGGSWLLRRRVVAPMDRVMLAADAVAGGNLDVPIEVQGPAEIERLAQRVSDMRDRIVEELAAVEAQRIELARRADDLARSNADLEQFAYVASHDLQEPLRKVASFCQLLEQRYGDQLDERGRSYIDFAVDGAKRMQALIADLLEFSRMGRSTRAFVECDLGAMAEEVLDSFADDLTDASVSVGELPTVPGDPTLYRALLQNLVGNAIKYRVHGAPPTISLSAARDGDVWSFACSDRGIGIEPQYREQVFAVFQRLHGRGEFEGTGIGLALCKRIVEFSGGRIWIDEPEHGAGTTVRWTLPVTPTPAPTTPTGLR
ncbi:MAG: histidine kinase [Ilumatobacteraceae bacterium]|nr:histidine kinase [Ilumatobacteraceae bacterium]